jgi:3-keto steroid reductase
VKFAAAADRWGAGMVRLEEIREWEKNKHDAAVLSVKYEELYQSFRTAEVTVDS